MDYFTSITPTDPYRVGRYEDSRGPNSILFGIGAGWLREETEIMGGDFEHRWTQTREAIEVMKALWTQDEVDVEALAGGSGEHLPLHQIAAAAARAATAFRMPSALDADACSASESSRA